MLKLYKPSSSKLYLRAELPFKAKELALMSQSCQNLDIVKVRTNLANYLLGLVSSCPQWHRAGCSDILNTIPYGPLTLAQSLRRRLVWIQPLTMWIWKLIFFHSIEEHFHLEKENLTVTKLNSMCFVLCRHCMKCGPALLSHLFLNWHQREAPGAQGIAAVWLQRHRATHLSLQPELGIHAKVRSA